MTQSGYTGFILSSYRPKSPLFIFSKEKTLINQLSLSWGVRAFHYAEEESIDEIVADLTEIFETKRFQSKKGDVIINTGSIPVDEHLQRISLKFRK